jgi:hypothetical protein
MSQDDNDEDDQAMVDSISQRNLKSAVVLPGDSIDIPESEMALKIGPGIRQTSKSAEQPRLAAYQAGILRHIHPSGYYIESYTKRVIVPIMMFILTAAVHSWDWR